MRGTPRRSRAAAAGRRRRTDLSGSQIDAQRRFDAAVAAAGPGLADILWRVVCAGEGMREAETALGWPARAGKLVLASRSTGSPTITGSDELKLTMRQS